MYFSLFAYVPVGCGFVLVWLWLLIPSHSHITPSQILCVGEGESEEVEEMVRLREEVVILRQLKHPNILSCLGATKQEGCVNIFTEWMEGNYRRLFRGGLSSRMEIIDVRWKLQWLMNSETTLLHVSKIVTQFGWCELTSILLSAKIVL